MATGGVSESGRSRLLPEIPGQRATKKAKPVKLFISSYSDEFFAERDLIRKEVKIIFYTTVRLDGRYYGILVQYICPSFHPLFTLHAITQNCCRQFL